ncbi:MAG TPA: AAA family ATPase [Patescibacteria group bacterium]|nr:AAA family ATPase [Patescibacteria group bacterium]
MSSSLFPEIQRLTEKLHTTQLPAPLLQKTEEEIRQIASLLERGGSSTRLDLIAQYIDWIVHLPWNTTSEDILDISHAKEIMDSHHHGLHAIKQRILEYLSVLILAQKNQTTHTYTPILLFVGLAGTGKTSFTSSIAEALGKKFARIPFGGLSLASDLRGGRKTIPEAAPGLIMRALYETGSRNPVILLDEIDRIAPEGKAGIMGVLIELLDPAQNNHFVDHYIDYPFDLSSVLFVATANTTHHIGAAVMDRLEVIEMPSYSDEEKIVIARDYILPRLMKESGLPKNCLAIDETVWKKIARMSGYDPGMRSVTRYVEEMVRKAAYKYVKKEGEQFTITEATMKDYVEE